MCCCDNEYFFVLLYDYVGVFHANINIQFTVCVLMLSIGHWTQTNQYALEHIKDWLYYNWMLS